VTRSNGKWTPQETNVKLLSAKSENPSNNFHLSRNVKSEPVLGSCVSARPKISRKKFGKSDAVYIARAKVISKIRKAFLGP
jgi:hypothetical protein